MRTPFLAVLYQACTAVAFPGLAALPLHPNGPNIVPRQSLPSNLPLSSQEGNSGPIPSLLFDPVDQFVDVRPGTAHAYVPPKSTDERGPCPGLNAAANHGFLPHNGIPNIPQSEFPKFQVRVPERYRPLLKYHSCCWSPSSLWSWPRVRCCPRRDCNRFNWRSNSGNMVYRRRLLSWNPNTRWSAHQPRRYLVFA